MAKEIDISDRAELWMDPEGEIYICAPNDQDGSFWSMVRPEGSLPTAYPKFVWELTGWRFLDRYQEQIEEIEI